MSISELHLVEAVGKCGGEGRTISGIAKELDITLPSVTVAINKLMKKRICGEVPLPVGRAFGAGDADKARAEGPGRPRVFFTGGLGPFGGKRIDK